VSTHSSSRSRFLAPCKNTCATPSAMAQHLCLIACRGLRIVIMSATPPSHDPKVPVHRPTSRSHVKASSWFSRCCKGELPFALSATPCRSGPFALNLAASLLHCLMAVGSTVAGLDHLQCLRANMQTPSGAAPLKVPRPSQAVFPLTSNAFGLLHMILLRHSGLCPTNSWGHMILMRAMI
jgi:hypothetical protein